jgi:predicted nucleotidyltransferase
VEVFLFGSAAGRGPFRLDSDVDIAVAGVPPGQYYQAWAVAEAAARSAGVGRLDLVDLASAADWLVREIRTTGERLT